MAGPKFHYVDPPLSMDLFSLDFMVQTVKLCTDG